MKKIYLILLFPFFVFAMDGENGEVVTALTTLFKSQSLRDLTLGGVDIQPSGWPSVKLVEDEEGSTSSSGGNGNGSTTSISSYLIDRRILKGSLDERLPSQLQLEALRYEKLFATTLGCQLPEDFVSSVLSGQSASIELESEVEKGRWLSVLMNQHSIDGKDKVSLSLTDITYKKMVEKEEKEKVERQVREDLISMIRDSVLNVKTILGSPLATDRKEVEVARSMDQLTYTTLLADIDSGSVLIERRPFNLKALLYKLEKEMGSSLLFECTQQAEEVIKKTLIGDETRLKDILYVLLTTPFQGASSEPPLLHIRAEEGDGQSLVLEITDRGALRATGRIDLITNRYDQLSREKQLKTIPQVCLHVASRLTSMLEGRLEIVDRDDEQTVTTLKIPISFDPSEATKTPKEVFNGRKVLIVEDTKSCWVTAQAYLKREGALVTVVENGVRAVEILKEKSFDAILMDLQMPVMGGLEATIKIRESGNKTPIIAWTASSGFSARKECLRVGMNGFLHKPLIVSTAAHEVDLTIREAARQL